ncbi:ribosome small subunit-dependent GTPase A [Enterococcus sp. LJL98]
MEGKIIKALSGFYYIENSGETYQTRARGNFRKRKITPLVGDNVIFESSSSIDGYLLEVLPRKNQLVRPAVANVDQGVVVTSLVEPNFSYNLLDRFLVSLEYEDIQPIIYLTKVDLLTDQVMVSEIKQVYDRIGYPVIVATEDAASVIEIEETFKEKLTVFMGQSGAGKSTLLNRIVPDLALETAEISAALGRGRHTTRHVELLAIAGGLVADTPGFSSIDFLEVDERELPKLFPEFVEVASDCRFRECSHVNEPDCAVKASVEASRIATTRYENYLQFLNEVKNRKPIYRKKK